MLARLHPTAALMVPSMQKQQLLMSKKKLFKQRLPKDPIYANRVYALPQGPPEFDEKHTDVFNAVLADERPCGAQPPGIALDTLFPSIECREHQGQTQDMGQEMLDVMRCWRAQKQRHWPQPPGETIPQRISDDRLLSNARAHGCSPIATSARLSHVACASGWPRSARLRRSSHMTCDAPSHGTAAPGLEGNQAEREAERGGRCKAEEQLEDRGIRII